MVLLLFLEVNNTLEMFYFSYVVIMYHLYMYPFAIELLLSTCERNVELEAGRSQRLLTRFPHRKPLSFDVCILWLTFSPRINIHDTV